jgi:hypothetical protein
MTIFKGESMRKEKESVLDQAILSLESAIEQKKSELCRHSSNDSSYNPLISMMGLKTILSLKVIGNIMKKSKEVTEETLSSMQQEIHEAPWKFLSKVGLIGLGLGIMLGSRYKEGSRRTK